MTSRRAKFFSGVAMSAVVIAGASASHAQAGEAPPVPPADTATASTTTLGEVIVTAQKRSQNINKVGMSIAAASGEQLLQQGITDTGQLTKIVPGFNFSQTAFATPVYTIRGVGFQESSLAASPAVSVYVDEVPLPFPIETLAAGLDLERVEVLKGPQGTLYGENSTGGAVNYIAAKPTSTPKAGFDVSYGRFNTADISAFLSGPLTDTLRARLSFRAIESGDWQKSYTSSATLGAQDKLEARLLLDWRPVERLKVSVNLNISRDDSETQAPQLIGISPSTTANPLASEIVNYPLAPANDQAAGWHPGVNYHRNNIFYQATIREDYDLPKEMVLSSITSYERFTRNQPVDFDGVPYDDLQELETGSLSTIFQELRLAGKFADKGHWIVGANYEYDTSADFNYYDYPLATTRIQVGVYDPDAASQTKQKVNTSAGYGNVEYNITPELTFQGGLRYTVADRSFSGCSFDTGDGRLAEVFDVLQAAFKGAANVVPVSPGGCVTLGPTFTPELVKSSLDESNVSWRVGFNWTPTSALLLYANISNGYKAGSFPTLAGASYVQFSPVKQENLLAYEGGFKIGMFERTLQLNGAVYYYDYTNKQIRGDLPDPIYGALEALVNVPKSHVDGFELSADWHPIKGLTISPAVTLVDSRIDGKFSAYTPLDNLVSVSGEMFPDAPKWQSYINAQYKWSLNNDYDGFVGGNVTYQGPTNGAFGNLNLYEIRQYMLVDLRAGVESKSGAYRLTVWGRNITNEYYWSFAGRGFDTDIRYAGMPATYGVTLSYRFK